MAKTYGKGLYHKLGGYEYKIPNMRTNLRC